MKPVRMQAASGMSHQFQPAPNVGSLGKLPQHAACALWLLLYEHCLEQCLVLTCMPVQDAWGRTALHWAAAYACEASIVLLLVRGAHAALLSHGGEAQPPLAPGDMAAAAGHVGLAAFLSEHALMQLMKDHNVTLDDPMTAREPLPYSARDVLLSIPPPLWSRVPQSDHLDPNLITESRMVLDVECFRCNLIAVNCWWADPDGMIIEIGGAAMQGMQGRACR